MDYIRSLRCEHALLLQESLFPVLQFLYLDLVRCGLRDHLKEVGFGLSEDMSRFSTELCQTLGEFFKRSIESSIGLFSNVIKKQFFDFYLRYTFA